MRVPLLRQILQRDGGQAGNAVLYHVLVEHDLAIVEGDQLLAPSGVDHHKGGGRTGQLAEEAEVLAAGEGLLDELGPAAGGGNGPVHQIDHFAVVVLQGIALLQVHLDVAVEGDTDALANTLHLFDGGIPCRIAEAAQHRHHLRFTGGDVHRVAAGHGAHRQYGGIHGVDAAGDHRLQNGDEIPGTGDGVVGGVGRGAVAALAVDSDVEQVHGTGEIALVQLHPAHGVVFGGADVLAEDGVHMGILHDARLHQLPCAAGHQILAGLKDQLDGAGEPVTEVAQRPGRAQQHGGMQVVAAGVHLALVLAGEGHAALLVDGQGVDVGAERHALAGAFLAVDQRHHGGGQGLLDLVHAHLLQLRADEGRGAYLLHARLGVGMDVAADGHQLVKNTICKRPDLRHFSKPLFRKIR